MVSDLGGTGGAAESDSTEPSGFQDTDSMEVDDDDDVEVDLWGIHFQSLSSTVSFEPTERMGNLTENLNWLNLMPTSVK